VSPKNSIFKWNDDIKRWSRVKGEAVDIGIGPDGNVFILGPKGRQSGQEIFEWTNRMKWTRINGSAQKVVVGKGGQPFILTKRNRIYWPD